ncbi:hypothetical protein VNO80_07912 [Phaseolus coccineus]|uniref:Homeobox domain-containing protein n=1 Tax=Phaseolus coccineus TaxID=3886 RepID=A0AAN9NPA5_PHACN
MAEKDDGVGLSLSLSLGVNQQPLKVNHMHHPQHQPQPQPQPVPINHNKTLFADLFQLPDRSSDVIRGIELKSAAYCEEDNGISSPNSAVSSVSGSKRSERDDDNAAMVAGERTSCSRGSDDDDGGGGDGDGGRKKLRLTKEQSMVLEETFKEHNTLNPKRKQALAEELNLKPRQVEVWFQNRRARTKLKQTEVDCEVLKRCCENLTEENRRLVKEVQELRALKSSPQMYMHMNPPTTLTMCPSCERGHSSSSSSPATVHSSAPTTRKLFGANIRRPVAVNTWPFDGSIPRQ